MPPLNIPLTLEIKLGRRISLQTGQTEKEIHAITSEHLEKKALKSTLIMSTDSYSVKFGLNVFPN